MGKRRRNFGQLTDLSGLKKLHPAVLELITGQAIGSVFMGLLGRMPQKPNVIIELLKALEAAQMRVAELEAAVRIVHNLHGHGCSRALDCLIDMVGTPDPEEGAGAENEQAAPGTDDDGDPWFDGDVPVKGGA